MVDSGRGGSDKYRNGRFMADYSAEQIYLKIKKKLYQTIFRCNFVPVFC